MKHITVDQNSLFINSLNDIVLACEYLYKTKHKTADNIPIYQVGIPNLLNNTMNGRLVPNKTTTRISRLNNLSQGCLPPFFGVCFSGLISSLFDLEL